MKKKKFENRKSVSMNNTYIEGAGIVENQPITQTLEKNYMPYAMSVILSRALPQIDGFKPSHRKLLYTMYKMGLLNGKLTKSANIVGATMKLNPHGDSAIYETMVRLSRGYQALLHPYVESKGNFGRFYSKDMAYAASRYTEAKLAPICNELFNEIEQDAVDLVPNYDNTTTEPSLLPTKFPSILVNSNVGIAVSMASSICPFNLKEVCETTINLIKDENFDILETLQGPDFPGGGFLIKDDSILKKIYNTGKGSIKIRSRYSFDKQNNCIDITEIPYTTTVEAIIEKIVDLIKQNKIKEIADIRDETDLNGLKLTIDLKRGTNPDKLMLKLFKYTPLEDSYACNFNILVNGSPKVMGIKEIIQEWRKFRYNCVKRRVKFKLDKKEKKLHLIKGLNKILLDIDKTIKIIRETDEESEVVPNLMIGFGIDKIQAEYVTEIKLRNLNREYILKRVYEKDELENDIKTLSDILKSDNKINSIICDELREIIKKYGQPRKTMFLYNIEQDETFNENEISNHPVNLFLTKDGYLKKISPNSLRLNSEQKLKENDKIITHLNLTNNTDLLFFSNKCQVYKTTLSAFKDSKASSLGEYVPAKLNFENDEKIIGMIATKNYSGNILFFFRNGKLAKIPLSSYQTKTNRKKLAKAYSDISPICKLFFEQTSGEYLVISNNKRYLIINSALISIKSTRTSQGVNVIKLNKDCFVENVKTYKDGDIYNSHKFRTKNLPARGVTPKSDDLEYQLKI